MASIFTPTTWPNVLGPYAIDINDCIGDSVGIINANTNHLLSYSRAVSSTASTQITNLSSLIYTPPAGGIIEYLANQCDGTTVTTRSGTSTTWQNVPAALQAGGGNLNAGQIINTTTFTDIVGSTISYQPPLGTKKVIYRFNFYFSAETDATPTIYTRFLIDNQPIGYAPLTIRGDNFPQILQTFEWVINIGGSTDSNTGGFATWTTPKTLKLASRISATNILTRLHATKYWRSDTTTGLTENNQFFMPSLTLVAVT